jgi:hypothetical protein
MKGLLVNLSCLLAIRLVLLISILFILCVPGASGGFVRFEQSNIILSDAEVQNFVSGIDAIARKGDVAIIAESVPLPKELDKQTVAKLSGREMTMEEAVNGIAEIYDYEVCYEKHAKNKDNHKNVIVLRKKYTDVRDLPDVTIEECARSVARIYQVLRSEGPIPPVESNTSLLRSIYARLSPEQRQRLLNDGMPLRDLDHLQQQMIKRMSLHLYLSAVLEDLQEADYYFKTFATQSVRRDMSGDTSKPEKSVLGIAIKDVLHRDGFIPLCDIVDVTSSADRKGNKRIIYQYTSIRDGATSLSDAVVEINNRLAKTSDGNHKPYSIDKELRDKTVAICGAENALPDQLAQALAEVYGLRIAIGTEQRRITTKNVPPVSGPFNAARAAQQLLPDSLRRFGRVGVKWEIYQDLEKAYSEQRSSPPDTRSQYESKINKLHRDLSLLQDSRLNDRELYPEIGRRIFWSAEELQKSDPKLSLMSGIPVSRLNPVGKSALANWYILPVMFSIEKYLDPGSAPFLTEFHRVILSGSIVVEKGRRHFSLYLNLVPPRGVKPRRYAGIADIELDDQ